LASNKVPVVKPVSWPRAVDPAGGFEQLVLMIEAIFKGAECWAFLLRSGIPMSSPDAIGVVLAG